MLGSANHIRPITYVLGTNTANIIAVLLQKLIMRNL